MGPRIPSTARIELKRGDREISVRRPLGPAAANIVGYAGPPVPEQAGAGAPGPPQGAGCARVGSFQTDLASPAKEANPDRLCSGANKKDRLSPVLGKNRCGLDQAAQPSSTGRRSRVSPLELCHQDSPARVWLLPGRSAPVWTSMVVMLRSTTR